jgi:hypothetical protein
MRIVPILLLLLLSMSSFVPILQQASAYQEIAVASQPQIAPQPPVPAGASFLNATSNDVAQFGGKDPGSLSYPQGVAIGPNGNVYVVDRLNGRVEEFSSSGTFVSNFPVTTNTTQSSYNLCFGNNVCGLFGITVDGQGNIYVTDTNSLGQVYGYVAAYGGNGTILKVTPQGSVSRFAYPGNYLGFASSFGGLTTNNAGELYAASVITSDITGACETGVLAYPLTGPQMGEKDENYAGCGTRTAEYTSSNPFQQTVSVAYDSNASSLFSFSRGTVIPFGGTSPPSDWLNMVGAGWPVSLQELNAGTGKLTTQWNFTESMFNVTSIAYNDKTNMVYLVDPAYNKVFELNASVPPPQSGPASLATFATLPEFSQPAGIATNGTAVYVTDQFNDRVYVLNSTGTIVSSFGKSSLQGNVVVATGAETSGGNTSTYIYTTDGPESPQFGTSFDNLFPVRISEFNVNGDLISRFPVPNLTSEHSGNPTLGQPDTEGLYVDSSQNIYYVANYGGAGYVTIMKFNPAGSLVGALNITDQFAHVYVGDTGTVYVGHGNGTIAIMNMNGTVVRKWATPISAEAMAGLTVANPSGIIYAYDNVQLIVYEYTQTGVLVKSTQVGVLDPTNGLLTRFITGEGGDVTSTCGAPCLATPGYGVTLGQYLASPINLLAVDGQGYMYLTNEREGSVMKIAPNGYEIMNIPLTPPGHNAGISFANDGMLYVSTGDSSSTVGDTYIHELSTALTFNTTLNYPLTTIVNQAPAYVVPGFPLKQIFTVTNIGTVPAYFLFTLVTPPYLSAANITTLVPEEGYSDVTIIQNTTGAVMLGIYLRPFEPVPISVMLHTSASAISSVPSGQSLDGAVLIQYAALPLGSWLSLVSSDSTQNLNQLITSALSESAANQTSFFSSLRQMTPSNLNDSVRALANIDPYVAQFIALTLFKSVDLDPVLQNATSSLTDATSSSTSPSQATSGSPASSSLVVSPALFYPSKVATPSQGRSLELLDFTHWATGCGNPDESSGCWYDFFSNVFDSQFFSTAGHSLCGFGAAAATAITLGEVRFSGGSQDFEIGKGIGYATIGTEVTLGTGLVVAEVASGTLGTGEVVVNGVTYSNNVIFSNTAGTVGIYGQSIQVAIESGVSSIQLLVTQAANAVTTVGVQSAAKLAALPILNYVVEAEENPSTIGTVITFVDEHAPGAEPVKTLVDALSSAYDANVVTVPAPYDCTNHPHIAPRISRDPNYLVSDPSQYINNVKNPITFTLGFENLPNATASAMNIKVDIALSENLNASTVKFISSSAPESLASMNVTAMTKSGVGPGTIQAYFANINLPPDIQSPAGEGSLTFSVMPLQNITEGSAVSAVGNVYFDFNAPVTTNNDTLVYDSVAPSSSATAKISGGTTLVINGAASDPVSGISTIYLSIVDDNSSSPYSNDTEVAVTSSGSFGYSMPSAVPGHTYSIYTEAVDNAGNIENRTSPDQTIKVLASSAQSSTSSAHSSTSSTPSAQSSDFVYVAVGIVVVVVVAGLIAFGLLRRKRSIQGPRP